MAGTVSVAAEQVINSLMTPVFTAAALYLGTLLLRRRSLAIAALFVFTGAGLSGRENVLLELPAGLILAGLSVLALVRFGLVGFAACQLGRLLLFSAPAARDLSSWYAGSDAFFVLAVLGPAVWAFLAARGRGRLIPQGALDGD
jgi:hypothetical protein